MELHAVDGEGAAAEEGRPRDEQCNGGAFARNEIGQRDAVAGDWNKTLCDKYFKYIYTSMEGIV